MATLGCKCPCPVFRVSLPPSLQRIWTFPICPSPEVSWYPKSFKVMKAALCCKQYVPVGATSLILPVPNYKRKKEGQNKTPSPPLCDVSMDSCAGIYGV